VARVKRRFPVATSGSVRLSWRFRAGADAKVAARGQAGGGRHEPARRRRRVSSDGDGGGYQAMRWSNSKAGADCAGDSQPESIVRFGAQIDMAGYARKFGQLYCGR